MTSFDASLAAQFVKRFGKSPTHSAAAPGRVNLIGEHIDYAGLSVLPIAIQRRVTLAYCHRPDTSVSLANRDPQYADRTFTLDGSVDPYQAGDWGNYVRAAAQGLRDCYGSLQGIDAVVCSDLPAAAGLSSSSALVVVSALALLDRNGITIDRLELAELLAKAERYVGVHGGGMDQAICLSAQPDTASRIDFNPLRLRTISVPSDWCFIVASSLVRASKSSEARTAYNQRTRECDEALATVLRGLRMSPRIRNYQELLAQVSGEAIEAVADGELHGVLRKRFRHVVSEAVRVSRAEEAMREGDVAKFGVLMRQSHDSLRHDFDVSCPELDELVSIATAAGAAGARLTGAGFGGCIVALCHKDEGDGILRTLADRFYADRGLEGDLRDELFIARSSEGASVRQLRCI